MATWVAKSIQGIETRVLSAQPALGLHPPRFVGIPSSPPSLFASLPYDAIAADLAELLNDSGVERPISILVPVA